MAARAAKTRLKTPIRLNRIKAVVDGLVRTVLTGHIRPSKTVADDEDNRADDPPVIHTRNAMRQWKIRLYTSHLSRAQQKQITNPDIL